jgi:hypothetical protein
MNFNFFSKKQEAAIPADSTVTLVVYLTDGADLSAVDKVYSLDEYEKSLENCRKIVKKIYDDIEKGKSIINAWNGLLLFKAEDFKRAVVTGVKNFKQNE